MRDLYHRIRLMTKFSSFIQTDKRLFYLLAICKLCLVLLSLLPPWLYMVLVDEVFVNKQHKMFPVIILGYLVSFGMETLILSVQRGTYHRFFSKLNLLVKCSLLKRIAYFPNKTYADYGVGELNNRIEKDSEFIEKFISTHILEYGYNILAVVVYASILLWMNPLLAICGFAMIPVSFLFAKIMGRRVHTTSEAYRKAQGKYEGFLFDALGNWREIKVNNLNEIELQEFESYASQLSRLFKKNQLYWWINRTFVAFKDLFITRMNLYFLGGILVIRGDIDVSVLLAFMNYYEHFYQAISSVIDMYIGLKNDLPNLERCIEMLEWEQEKPEKTPWLSNDIKFVNVSFRYYPEQEWVLNNLSVDIEYPSLVAIVGSSGSGKSTLLKLLCGLLDPLQGEVRIGGQNIISLDIQTLSQKIGIVLQEPYFLNLSIKENLLLAKPRASHQELLQACQKANILDFIECLPDGINTVIGERGVKLSGGQRQRIAIAQVILKNPDIVVFDEATSALDEKNSSMITDCIFELSKEKTVIIVAHRLPAIRMCNRVLLLDNGAIVADGSHKLLQVTNQKYREIFHNQIFN